MGVILTTDSIILDAVLKHRTQKKEGSIGELSFFLPNEGGRTS